MNIRVVLDSSDSKTRLVGLLTRRSVTGWLVIRNNGRSPACVGDQR